MLLDLSLDEITIDNCLVINKQETIEVSRSLERSSDLKILENQANLKIREILSKNKFPINVLPSLKGRVLKLNIIFSNDFMNKKVVKKIRLQLGQEEIYPDMDIFLEDNNSVLTKTDNYILIKLKKI